MSVVADERPRSRWVVILLGLMTAGALLGCAGAHSRARAGSLTITSRGDAAAPALAVRTLERETIRLPAGTVIETGGTADVPPVRKTTLPAAADLVRETTRDELRTATAHAPPDPAAVAKADGVRTYWRISLVCLLLGALLAWRRHWWGAACAALAGVILPLLATFTASRWGEIAGGLLVGAAVAFFGAWHVLRLRGKIPVEYPRQA